MKKMILMVSILVGLCVSGVFGDTWTSMLGLCGFSSWVGSTQSYTNVANGIYSCYYDSSAKSMTISIEFYQDANNSKTISIKENSNPKLFLYVKEAIDKHLSSNGSYQMTAARYGQPYNNLYGYIAFKYDGQNNINGFKFGRWYAN